MRKEEGPETTIRVVQKEEEFPDSLDGRVEAVLSTVNISIKSITLLSLEGYMQRPIDLSNRVAELLERTDAGHMHFRQLVDAYCKWTLCPIGLVAEQVAIDYAGIQYTAGYLLTDAGQRYGQPVAAKFLEFEAERFSLFPILGPVGTPSKKQRRPPFQRAKLLKGVNAGLNQQSSLCKWVGLANTNVQGHLEAMAEAGVISYRSINPYVDNGERVEYRLNESYEEAEVNQVGKEADLTDSVFLACLELKDAGKTITAANVIRILPIEYVNRVSRRQLMGRVSMVLSNFADEQGFLVRGDFHGRDVQSIVEITDKGRLVLEELLLPLDDALSDGTTLDTWRHETLPKVRGQLPVYAAKSADLYYPFSKAADMRLAAERRATAERLLKEAGNNGLTVRTLAERLGVHMQTARAILNKKVREGSAMREKFGNAYYYFSAEN